MPFPPAVAELVERFTAHQESYKSPQYNETQLRREFVDPFFKALGWDVDNQQGNAEAYKDVVHEDAIKIGGTTKAPDYCFRIGGQRKFFVETKKPSVDIAHDASPAYQLRRYAWTAKLSLSILTDFEELAVYDCLTYKPDQNDKPSKGRVLYLKYTDYTDRWDELADIFSRDAILKGRFDKYAQTHKKKRGTAEVDAEFLKEIEDWRSQLARNLALRNPEISQSNLNFAVQRTIDRIIFLRICEARGIERSEQLRALLNGEKVYKRLGQLFEQADDRYNSGLFHFHKEKGRTEPPDELTLALAIDDKPLKQIIRKLYYPDSPYEFSVLPAEILGQVYEQFLGKVIRLTKGHQAKVEEKPEVKKAGGVYYTPSYIVDYIVEQTVGKLLEGKTPREVGGLTKTGKPSKTARPLAVLDPACGSGSFLIGAYCYLLDWYRDWYADNDPKKWARGKNPTIYLGGLVRSARIHAGRDGPDESGSVKSGPDESGHYEQNWRLTTAERKRILLAHIYGVDIDPQAVEVTKLSLLLKVLEGENRETLDRQLKLFKERALPDLSSNIKCGNSLIGPDFYEGRQMELFDEDELLRINAFDWNEEFPQIMKAGGFDVVIGNPPYVRIQTMRDTAPHTIDYYKQHYTAASKGNYDIYVLFVERGLRLLNKDGYVGLILPHKFFNAHYGRSLRELVTEGGHLSHVVHFTDEQVFRGATTYTCLMFLTKSANESVDYVRVEDLDAWRTANSFEQAEVPAKRFTPDEWNITIGRGADVLDRVAKSPLKLANVVDRMYQGSITSADTVFLFKEWRSANEHTLDVFSKALDEWAPLEDALLKPVIRSGSIGRYWAQPTAYVLFPYEVSDGCARLFTSEEMATDYPLAWSYLLKNRRLLEQRERAKFKDLDWYRFGRSQNLGMWEQSKLMLPYMVTNLSAYLDREHHYYFINVTTGGYGVTTQDTRISPTYLCGLLNSRLLDFCLKRVSTTFHGGYFAASKQYIEQLPIRTIDFSDSGERARHDDICSLVERMLDLNQRVAEVKTAHYKTSIQRQIAATDRQIDQLVYELYGLTDEEIRIVEEANCS